jgi:hypothetical protein
MIGRVDIIIIRKYKNKFNIMKVMNYDYNNTSESLFGPNNSKQKII